MGDIKIEFSVENLGPECVEKIKKSLNGIGTVDFNMNVGSVIVNTKIPWSEVQDKIEETGKVAVLSGFGGQSAVAMIQNKNNIKGVVRFTRINNNGDGCVIDGAVDGLSPGLHGMHIHECGDLSNGCASTGEHYNPRGSPHGSPNDLPTKRHAGDLGNIRATENGRATFRFIDNFMSLGDIIGRSIVIKEHEDDYGRGSAKSSQIDGNCGIGIACGIIARSAGIMQNYKKMCACDGVTIWDERDTPLAGGSRNKNNGKL